MAWESDLLTTCGRLKEAADSMATSIGRMVLELDLPLPDDITAEQLSAIYRLARAACSQRASTGPTCSARESRHFEGGA